MNERRTKTRWYYTDYVNHMVRFYITCPDGLRMEGKRKCDVENWCAVQGVFYKMPDEEREKVLRIYKTHYNLPKAVDTYCDETGDDVDRVWALLAKTTMRIAKTRGLI